MDKYLKECILENEVLPKQAEAWRVRKCIAEKLQISMEESEKILCAANDQRKESKISLASGASRGEHAIPGNYVICHDFPYWWVFLNE